jgi:hypothetical protein
MLVDFRNLRASHSTSVMIVMTGCRQMTGVMESMEFTVHALLGRAVDRCKLSDCSRLSAL